MAKDELLYSGQTSQSSGSQRVKAQLEQNLENKSKLLPFAKVVNEFLDAEKAKLVSLNDIVLGDKKHEDLEVDLKVRKGIYVELERIQNRVATILRAEAKNE